MKKVNIGKVYHILRKEVKRYKVPVVDLIKMQTRDPYKVLVATILSARTKDETTYKACSRLFGRANSLFELEKLSVSEIQGLIYPVGFYSSKARYLGRLSLSVRKMFNGLIPATVDELVQLPGVGRKTANLVVAVAFNKPAICVDVHVHRICNRLGYVRTRTPEQTEFALRQKLPIRYWTTFNSMLVAFGQQVCRPVSPHCSTCPISEHCNRIGVRQYR